MSTQTTQPLERLGSGGAPLEIRNEDGQTRHYLRGRPLTPGIRLEVLLPGGRWLAGVYEWSGVHTRWPVLRFELGGPWEQGHGRQVTAAMPISPDALLRIVE